MANRTWEYKKTEASYTDFESHLNELGRSGWEAMAVDFNFRPGGVMIVLKRPTGKEA